MKRKPHDDRHPLSLKHLSAEIYETLAQRFPVCLGSDEFHFFPHYRSIDHDWSAWDDFSSASVADIITKISQWEAQLAAPALDLANGVNVGAATLTRLLTTLREQLGWVRFQENQPSFYLTIAGIGLAEAFDAGPEEFARRLERLPLFLDQAAINLKRPPRLYLELGLEMADKIGQWLASLSNSPISCRPAVAAIQNFIDRLTSKEPKTDFLLPPEIYGHIAKYHMGCGISLTEIEDQLAAEINETETLMAEAARDLCPGVPWQDVLADLPSPSEDQTDPTTIYGEVIENLYRHCDEQAFLLENVPPDHRVRIQEIPDYMRLVRSNAAFSMPPGHPPGTGIFYILPAKAGRKVPSDYRLLSAHETYPGHQLLDICRWLLPDTVQRPIEFPLFYEGWAAFSEEILFDTGFFSSATDHLLMAKRRYWRALRGLTDLRIHSGRSDLSTAAEGLIAKRLSSTVSKDMVRRYALKPGYQLAYTVGRHRFHRLYTRHKAHGGRIDVFVRSVLASGEIGFDNLEHNLNSKEENH